MSDKKLARQTGDNLRAIKDLRRRTKKMCDDIRERQSEGQQVTYYGKPQPDWSMKDV